MESHTPWQMVKARQQARGVRMGSGHICGHCQRPQVGNAFAGNKPLCHPDFGMDCYRMVTVYKHPTPCYCGGESEHPDRDVCDHCEYRRLEHATDVEDPRVDFLGNPVPCDDFTPKPRYLAPPPFDT